MKPPPSDLRMVTRDGRTTSLESGDVVAYNIKADEWTVTREGKRLSFVTNRTMKDEKYLHHLPKRIADAVEIMDLYSAFANIIIERLASTNPTIVKWRIV